MKPLYTHCREISAALESGCDAARAIADRVSQSLFQRPSEDAPDLARENKILLSIRSGGSGDWDVQIVVRGAFEGVVRFSLDECSSIERDFLLSLLDTPEGEQFALAGNVDEIRFSGATLECSGLDEAYDRMRLFSLHYGDDPQIGRELAIFEHVAALAIGELLVDFEHLSHVAHSCACLCIAGIEGPFRQIGRVIADVLRPDLSELGELPGADPRTRGLIDIAKAAVFIGDIGLLNRTIEDIGTVIPLRGGPPPTLGALIADLVVGGYVNQAESLLDAIDSASARIDVSSAAVDTLLARVPYTQREQNAAIRLTGAIRADLEVVNVRLIESFSTAEYSEKSASCTGSGTLVSMLMRTGQVEEALNTVETTLRVHPGNVILASQVLDRFVRACRIPDHAADLESIISIIEVFSATLPSERERALLQLFIGRDICPRITGDPEGIVLDRLCRASVNPVTVNTLRLRDVLRNHDRPLEDFEPAQNDIHDINSWIDATCACLPPGSRRTAILSSLVEALESNSTVEIYPSEGGSIREQWHYHYRTHEYPRVTSMRALCAANEPELASRLLRSFDMATPRAIEAGLILAGHYRRTGNVGASDALVQQAFTDFEDLSRWGSASDELRTGYGAEVDDNAHVWPNIREILARNDEGFTPEVCRAAGGAFTARALAANGFYEEGRALFASIERDFHALSPEAKSHCIYGITQHLSWHIRAGL